MIPILSFSFLVGDDRMFSVECAGLHWQALLFHLQPHLKFSPFLYSCFINSNSCLECWHGGWQRYSTCCLPGWWRDWGSTMMQRFLIWRRNFGGQSLQPDERGIISDEASSWLHVGWVYIDIKNFILTLWGVNIRVPIDVQFSVQVYAILPNGE